MDEKLKRVIGLAAQLQEAMKECECVLGYNVTHIAGVIDGRLHISYPDKFGFTDLEPDYIDKVGEQWVKTSYGGVEICGILSREAATNESP